MRIPPSAAWPSCRSRPGGGTWTTTDGGAAWVFAPGSGGYRVWPAGNPPMLWTDGPRKSTDLGRSWTYLDVGSDKVVVRGVNPVNPDELLASSHNYGTLFRSIDGGKTWSPDTLPGVSSDLAVDWSTRRMYAKVGNSLARKRIDDAGPWSMSAIGPVDIGAGNGVLLVRNGSNVILRSTDGGATFSTFGFEQYSFCEFAFAAPPSSRVYAIDCFTQQLFRSNDGGNSWHYEVTFEDGAA